MKKYRQRPDVKDRQNRRDLTAERLREILAYCPENGTFRWIEAASGRRVGEIAGTLDHHGYICICVAGTDYRAQRMAWLYATGKWPEEVDHCNGIRRSQERRVGNGGVSK